MLRFHAECQGNAREQPVRVDLIHIEMLVDSCGTRDGLACGSRSKMRQRQTVHVPEFALGLRELLFAV